MSDNGRIGETRQMKCGLSATIIEYRNSHDIDIKFEDGVLALHKYYRDFRMGLIKHKFGANYYIGMTVKSRMGQDVTIIDFKSKSNITVQFEDGTVVENVEYKHFKDGYVSNPNEVKNRYLHRVGEIRESKYNQTMEIIEYKSATDIKVRFGDGTIVETKYHLFKQGDVYNPSLKLDRTGEYKVMACGIGATVIRYAECDDIDVKFDNGFILNSVSYTRFKNGLLIPSNADSRLYRSYNRYINAVNRATNGQEMTVVDFISCDNVTVKFEDGTIVKGISINRFLSGSVKNPNYTTIKSRQDQLVGKINRATNGLDMKIIKVDDRHHIDIEFEDGYIAYNKTYSAFKNGIIRNINIGKGGKGNIGTFKVSKLAFRTEDKNVFYECRCIKCGHEGIMTPQEMLKHNCERNE